MACPDCASTATTRRKGRTAKRNREHISRPSGSRVAEPRGSAAAFIRSNIRALRRPAGRHGDLCLVPRRQVRGPRRQMGDHRREPR